MDIPDGDTTNHARKIARLLKSCNRAAGSALATRMIDDDVRVILTLADFVDAVRDNTHTIVLTPQQLHNPN